ncbi:metal-dependent hydrolase [Natrialbaceae archaeon A-gly3]
MYRAGHAGVSMAAYAPLGVGVALTWDVSVAAAGLGAAVALSTLPDVDQVLSTVDHRGPTHSLPFAVFVGVALAAATAVLSGPLGLSPSTGLLAFAFVVGVLSILTHLLADVITPMGIRPFWPVSDRHYTLEITPAANPVANYLLLSIGLATVLVGTVLVESLG